MDSLAATSLYLPFVSNQPPPPGLVDSDWHLVVDDGHLAFRDVGRRYHPFQKHPDNPLIIGDLPWEGEIIQLYGTVLRQDSFRMWYSAYNDETQSTNVLYARSEDGINWVKPKTKDDGKNVVVVDANLASVIYMPEDVERPYKLMVNKKSAFYGYWSVDGIRLNEYSRFPLFTIGTDVAHYYWDAATNMYRGTVKQSVEIDQNLTRVVRLIESANFEDWTVRPESLVPDALDKTLNPGTFTHFYGMTVFPAGQQFLGFLWVLDATDSDGQHGEVHTQLVSSHDGFHWTREEGDRPAMLDVGPPESWDVGQVYTALSPVVVGDEYWLYYSGCNLEHGEPLTNMICSIGLATAPYNRLVSLYGNGNILTEVYTAPGAQLHLNYDGSQGALRVELLNGGTPIPGYEVSASRALTGNSRDEVAAWTNRSTLPTQPFQVKFYLENSALYAYKMQ